MLNFVDQKELEWKDLQLSDAVIRDLLQRSSWTYYHYQPQAIPLAHPLVGRIIISYKHPSLVPQLT